MFTGIVTDIGTVASIERHRDARFGIACGYDLDTVATGASISCAGCCLTVTAKAAGRFFVDVSVESLSRTTLGGWSAGTRVNLERALRAGDELGGHIVSGHVDGVAEILSIHDDASSRRFVFKVPGDLVRFVAPKGSIALDGTSLTVNEVDGATFGVNLIPHTLAVTAWGEARVGGRVNVEIDMLARYVARLHDRGTS